MARRKATILRDCDGWLQVEGGHLRWRVIEDGRLQVADARRELERAQDDDTRGFLDGLVVDADGCPRTRGNPTTMGTEIRRWGDDMAEVAGELGLTEADQLTMWAIIGVEAGRSSAQRGRDIFSLRYEDGFEGFDARGWEGEFSAGLVQTTMATARTAAREMGAVVTGLDGRPRELQPGDLCIPRNSLHLGLRHLRKLKAKHGDDPQLLQTAWNTGGVYPDPSVRCGLYLKHSDRRWWQFCAWHNDARAVLSGGGR